MPSYRPSKSSDLSTHHTTSSRASTSAHATSTASAGAPTNITISPAHRRACEFAMEKGRASALAEQKEKDKAASGIFEDLTKDTDSNHTRAFQEYCKTHDLDPLNSNNKVIFAEEKVPGSYIQDKWTFWNSESATETLPENDNDVFGGDARVAPSRGAGSTVSS